MTKFTLLPLLLEKADPAMQQTADSIVALLSASLDAEEMTAKRGADFSKTKYFQIRVKPAKECALDAGSSLDTLAADIYGVLKKEARRLGLSDLQANKPAINSSKFHGISFVMRGSPYEIVVAAGKNKGECFEINLLQTLDDLITGRSSVPEAELALAALQEVDPAFKLSNIAAVMPRAGSTKRSGGAAAESGKIIGDIIIKLKRGGDRYISVKDIDGKTVGKFGVAAAFSNDLKVNRSSAEWKNLLAPFGLDADKIEQGLAAAASGEDLDWNDIEEVDKAVPQTSKMFKNLEQLWGSDYYYLRKKKGGFFALKVDDASLKNVILKNLRLTEIRYPSKSRKQISIKAVSDAMTFVIEVRNTSGGLRPMELTLTISKTHI